MKSLSLILLSFFLSSCSLRREEGPVFNELMTTFANDWYSVNPKHGLIDSGNNNRPLPHLLLDTTPEFNSVERTINVIVAVPKGSQHSYDIDIYSGQKHFTHSYCKQKDVWNSYAGAINRPVFSIGYIPRVLDQLGEVQKVIIFTKRKGFIDIAETNYQKVRLIAAYVEQVCPEGNCIGKSNWLSKLVFIGVDSSDDALAGIKTIADFQKDFDWETSKAYLENIEGRNFIGEKTYPAVKVGHLLEYPDAFKYFKKRSIFLTETELKKIQQGCHALYDSLWEKVGKTRPEDLSANTLDELKAKIKLKNEMGAKRLPFGFGKRFQAFTKKYSDEIATCEKLVYHGNINRDPEAFWFLSFMGLYYRMHREGHHFDCRSRTWQKNGLDDQGNKKFDLKEGVVGCQAQEIDQAMNLLPNYLNSLKGDKVFYRFIDYDNHEFGSHRKLYSWVKIKARKLGCRNDPNVEIRKKMKIFPEDVTWKERAVKDIEDELKIIY